MKRSLRNGALFLGLIIPAILVNAAGHEYVHFGVANLVGIPVERMVWFNRATLSPAIFFDVAAPSLALSIVHYSGGLVMGLVWFVGYLVWHGRMWAASRSYARWIAGVVIAILAFHQVGQGIIEGALHDAYIGGAGNPFSPSGILQLVPVLIGFFIHMRVTNIWKLMKHWNSTRRPAES